MAIGTHHKKICIARRNVGLKHLTNAATRRVNCIQDHLHTVASQMFGELRAGPLGVKNLLVCDHHNAHKLRPFQDRKRIGDGARRRAAVIPGHNHGIKRKCAGPFWRLG